MDFNTLDGKIEVRWLRSSCMLCAYFDGPKRGTCLAFPNGIPDKYVVSDSELFAEKHSEVVSGQTGDYIFKLRN